MARAASPTLPTSWTKSQFYFRRRILIKFMHFRCNFHQNRAQNALKQKWIRFFFFRCYEGDWVNGKREGVGKFTYADGAVYEGEWKDDRIHGQGRSVFASGNRYEGCWNNGRINGWPKIQNEKIKIPTDVKMFVANLFYPFPHANLAKECIFASNSLICKSHNFNWICLF